MTTHDILCSMVRLTAMAYGAHCTVWGEYAQTPEEWLQSGGWREQVCDFDLLKAAMEGRTA